MQDFRYHDPRQLEGTPYEVAGAAFSQALSVGKLYQRALEDAFILARNAEMERNLQAGLAPDGAGFPDTALGCRMTATKDDFKRIQRMVTGEQSAACYDPSAEVEV